MDIKDRVKRFLSTEHRRRSKWEDWLPKEWFEKPDHVGMASKFSNDEYENFANQINDENEVSHNWRALGDPQQLREHIKKYAIVWGGHQRNLLFNHVYFVILDRLPEGITSEEAAVRLIEELDSLESRLKIQQGSSGRNKEVIERIQKKIGQIRDGFSSAPRTTDAPVDAEIVKDPPQKIEPEPVKLREKPKQRLVDKVAEEAPRKIEPEPVKLREKPKLRLVDKVAEEAPRKIEPEPVKLREKPKQRLVDKIAEEAPRKIEPEPVKLREKPKLRLVDKIAEEVEKARKEIEDSEEGVQDKSNEVIEFAPLISDASLVKHGCRLVDIKVTTNNKTAINSPMKNTFFLSGSSGDFMSPKLPNQTKNQDLMAIVESEEGDLTRVFVFDGVSQSLRPREWAEALLESALEIGLGIESTKDDAILSKWYNKSAEKWRNWIEQEYESKRERRAIWIEEQRIRDAHSTLTILEIGKESVEIAQVGDSPFFAYNSVTKKSIMTPQNFDHKSGPRTIGTDRMFMSEELSYEKLDIVKWDYYIACTDSIGDYLNENLSDVAGSVDFLESMLGQNPQRILCDMMARGRGSDGLIEDDLSLFIFTKHGKSGK
jgi:serine/threonine protein phosphatase PrpC